MKEIGKGSVLATILKVRDQGLSFKYKVDKVRHRKCLVMYVSELCISRYGDVSVDSIIVKPANAVRKI